MGKISTLNQHQKEILAEIANNSQICSRYYFTGGTALSEYYLHHRVSVDLDFFSEQKQDPEILLDVISKLRNKFGVQVQARNLEVVNIYNLAFPDGVKLKVDFGYYPYRRVEKSGRRVGKMEVDSLVDIAVNKLSTITQRAEVKDFVDLYFLLKKFTFWDLRNGVKVKFGIDVDPYVAANDFVALDIFEYLPEMIRPLTLDQLKDFFRKEAIKLGRMAVED